MIPPAQSRNAEAELKVDWDQARNGGLLVDCANVVWDELTPFLNNLTVLNILIGARRLGKSQRCLLDHLTVLPPTPPWSILEGQ